jgi:beta-glucosidase
LLKNENGLLPLCRKKVGVVGEFAKTPRYQGGGASNVHPARLPSFLDELAANGIPYEYGESAEPDVAIAFLGQPVSFDSEGYDRPSMSIPAEQAAMLERLAGTGKKVVAAIFAGGAVETPWIELADAVIMCYLPGQAGAGAVFDAIFGKVNPSGKLAESFPKSCDDVASMAFFGQENIIEYRESVFVGYRHYASAGIEVSFPFGHGLSYTSFTYSDLLAEKRDGRAVASFKVKNAGSVFGAEVCQLYVSPPESPVARPVKELKGFKKARLSPGEETELSFVLEERDFSYWNPIVHGWRVAPGEYGILIGSSSEDIRLRGSVILDGSIEEMPDLTKAAPEFHDLKRLKRISRESFEAALGRKVPEHSALPITRFSTLKEIRLTFVGRLIEKLVGKGGGGEAAPQEGQDLQVMLDAQADFLPIFALVAFTGGAVSFEALDGLIMAMNGRYLRGIAKFLGALLKRKKR